MPLCPTMGRRHSLIWHSLCEREVNGRSLTWAKRWKICDCIYYNIRLSPDAPCEGDAKRCEMLDAAFANLSSWTLTFGAEPRPAQQ